MRMRLSTGLALAALVLAQTGLCGAPAPPAVMANGERLIGAWEAGEPPVAVFRGVPFAAPPVGRLRWRAPAPHRPRSGPQRATGFAPACMQGQGQVDWYIGVAAAFGHGPEVVARPEGVSEDCLYLNIWSPRPERNAALPVMVFVHGGSNSGGWSYEPNYRGMQLARRGVVVVTIAYRLGPFGFFAHPALGDGKAEPVANFALLDIRAAFQWVRDHIAAFGGDPGNLTAFGESAGAFNLLDLLLADVAAGSVRDSLFRRSILQSTGEPLLERQTLAEEQALGRRLLAALGLGDEAEAERIRAVPASELLAAVERLPGDHYPDGVIDGRLITAHPLHVLGARRADGVEIVLGSNADEWLMYLGEDAGPEDLARWVNAQGVEEPGALLAAVGGETDPRRALDRLITAREIRCPSRAVADAVNARGGRAWLYYFSRRREGPGGDRLGAYHGAELPYVFGTHDVWLPTEPADRALTDAVMDYWTAFARQGRPAAAGLPAWPVHGAARPLVLRLDEDIRAAGAVDPELCDLLGPRHFPAAVGNHE